MSACLSDEQMALLLEGQTSEAERAVAEDHIDGCPRCRQLLVAAGRDGGRVSFGVAATAPASAKSEGDRPRRVTAPRHAVSREAEDATSPAPSHAERPGSTPPSPSRGATIGRYVIMDLLGAGAMGEVHAAYDPELDRKVAIKILRPHAGDSGELETRLLREAQAMAKLSHANVVPVHDAGKYHSQVFVAMEYVQGRTLRAWQRERHRSVKEILRAYIAAGRGLAAAHAAGIVHRDFKPDNVLVGLDETVRVTDFGLARSVSSAVELSSISAQALSKDIEVDKLTHTGAVVGTPAYMAPEQVSGKSTPATDQFSFCVALYEALYDARPFAGDSLAGLLEAIDRGSVQPPPARSRVPGWIRRVLLRGLRSAKRDRYRSMNDLLDALERDPARRLRRIAAVALLLVGTGVAGAISYRSGQRRASLCEGAADEFAAVWNAASRRKVHEALTTGAPDWAESTWQSLQKVIDGRAAEWIAMHTAACEATRLKGTQSEELLDLRMECLRQRRGEVSALVDVLSHPAPNVAERALRAAYALPPVDRCTAGAVLEARVPGPSAAVRDRVAEVRARLPGAMALLGAGHYDAALITTRHLVYAARALAYPALEAEALLLLGNVELETGKVDGARLSFEESLEAAIAGSDDRTAAAALAGEARAVGIVQGKLAEAEGARRHGLTIATRIEARDVAADLLYAEALARRDVGNHAAARELLQKVRAARAQLFGEPSLPVAEALRGIANASRQLGELKEARAIAEQALAMYEGLLGNSHPALASTLNNLALQLWEDFGDYDGAEHLLGRALELERKRGSATPGLHLSTINLAAVRADHGSYGEALALVEQGLRGLGGFVDPRHPGLVHGQYIRGLILTALGRYEDATEQLRKVIDANIAREGPESFNVGLGLFSLADLEIAAGRADEALVDARKAMAICAKELPPGHPGLASAEATLCHALVEAASTAKAAPTAEATATCERALATAERAFGPQHPAVAIALAGVAEDRLARSDSAAAVGPLERALAFLEPRQGDLPTRARVRFDLARALVDGHGDAERARKLAQLALEDLASIGSRDPRARDEIAGWLARR